MHGTKRRDPKDGIGKGFKTSPSWHSETQMDHTTERLPLDELKTVVLFKPHSSHWGIFEAFFWHFHEERF